MHWPPLLRVTVAERSMEPALRPGDWLLVRRTRRIRAGQDNFGRVGPDWAVITEFSTPAPDKFVRDITTFVPDGAGGWRRGGERHENVLVDTSLIPALLGAHGVAARVGSSFGEAELPAGLRAVTGIRS